MAVPSSQPSRRVEFEPDYITGTVETTTADAVLQDAAARGAPVTEYPQDVWQEEVIVAGPIAGQEAGAAHAPYPQLLDPPLVPAKAPPSVLAPPPYSELLSGPRLPAVTPDVAASKESPANPVYTQIAETARRGPGPGLGSLMEVVLRDWPSNDAGLAQLRQQLDRDGLLQQFFDFAVYDDVWNLLVQRGVTADMLLDSVTAYDPRYSIDLFAGFLTGAGAQMLSMPADLLQALQAITGSIWDHTLVQDTKQFTAALLKLLTEPQIAKSLGEQWFQDWTRALARRQYFLAGAELGSAVTSVIDLAHSLVELPGQLAKAGRAATAVGRALARTSVRSIVQKLSRVDLAAVKAALTQRLARWTTPSGTAFERAGTDLVVTSPSGEVLGQLPFADLTEAEIDAALARLDQLAAANIGEAAAQLETAIDPLEGLRMDQLTEYVAQQLPSQGPMTPQLGTRRHTLLFELLEAITAKSAPQIAHHIDTPFRQMPGINVPLPDQKVADFLKARGMLDEFRTLGSDVLDSVVGDIRPDLISLDTVTGHAIVWDMTSIPRKPHLTKTMLAALILSEASPGYIRIAESYHGDISAAIRKGSLSYERQLARIRRAAEAVQNGEGDN
ncbi:hypothetical protein ACFW3D_28335 [Streptomyces sp. NPDC058864]